MKWTNGHLCSTVDQTCTVIDIFPRVLVRQFGCGQMALPFRMAQPKTLRKLVVDAFTSKRQREEWLEQHEPTHEHFRIFLTGKLPGKQCNSRAEL